MLTLEFGGVVAPLRSAVADVDGIFGALPSPSSRLVEVSVISDNDILRLESVGSMIACLWGALVAVDMDVCRLGCAGSAADCCVPALGLGDGAFAFDEPDFGLS